MNQRSRRLETRLGGWFASERVNVLAALRVAFNREWHDRVFRLPEALWPLCASHKYFAEWVESQQIAIDATIRSGGRPGEARVRSQLARAYAELGDIARTDEQTRPAVAAVHGCGDARLHASVVEFGGLCDLRLARPELALVAFRQAHAQFEAFGHTRGMALQQYYSGCAFVDRSNRRGNHRARQRLRRSSTYRATKSAWDASSSAVERR